MPGLNRYLESRQDRNLWRSVLAEIENYGALEADTAYWTYLGGVYVPILLKYAIFQVTTKGVGAQEAELCIAASPKGPPSTGETLTPLASSGTIDDLTTEGIKRNATPFDVEIQPFQHIWVGLRTNMANTQPRVRMLGWDMECGYLQKTANAGALTGAGPWSGALVPATEEAQGVMFLLKVDLI